MAPSLSLKTYLTLARREPLRFQPKRLPRAGSAVIWLHCSDPERALAMAQLGLRLAALRSDAEVMITHPEGQPLLVDLPEDVIVESLPSENPLDVTKFLNHWSPDALIWMGPTVRPSLLFGANQRELPMVFVDADTPRLEHKNWRWLPDSLRSTLQMFSKIYARDADSGARLRRLVGAQTWVEDSGPLQEESPVLGYAESDLEDLGEALKGRPVWLASRVQTGELTALFSAHRNSLKLSPRMLLIIVPDDPKDAGAVLSACEEGGWRVSLWDNGEMPDEKTHILLAEDAAELGVFYRMAPMSFLGSSLAMGQDGRNPFEATSLGSAVLYGPGVRQHLDAYSKLAKAGAAQLVKDAESLSAAVAGLMAPDKVAKMVHAGWEVVSEGALVSDRIIDHVNIEMDQRGAS